MERRLRQFARALLAGALIVSSGDALGAQSLPRPVGDERLQAVADRYFAELWSVDPVRATQVGVHAYDDRLGDYSAAAYQERVAMTRRYRAEAAAIDPSSLGAEGSYDAQILIARLDETLLRLQTRELWRHDPSLYTGTASNAIYALLARNFAPLKTRIRLAIARERAIPGLLSQGKANITTVDAVTAEVTQRNIQGTIGFFTSVLPAAVAKAGDAPLQSEFKTANDASVAALRDYLQAMVNGPFAHPSGTFAVGPKLYAQMLALQELTPIPLADYQRVGETALAATQDEFVATAAKIDPSKPPEAVAEALRTDHPAADALLRTATAQLGELRAFVVVHHIITLPPDDSVKVIATPEFARETTFASMNSPGPLEKVATEAYYNVTPVEPDWSPERKEQHLGFFNNYAFPLVSAHEVMPGHYVNFAIERRETLSSIRRIMSSPSFAEGWAHYTEQMMVDEGWGNGEPRVRLAQLQLALQRECRYLVGLREHTQGMTLEGAAKFFRDNAFMAAEPARREALRGTQDPLYGYYTLGKLEILKLRNDYHKRLGSKFTLQAFHDQLLAHGDPPVAIARKIMLGADDDGHLL